MSTLPSDNLSQAIYDLAAIRRAIEHAAEPKPSADATRLGIIIHSVLSILCVSFLIVEIASGGRLTWGLYASMDFAILRFLGVLVIGFVLLCLCGALYFSLWSASRNAGESFEEFVGRNFRPLRRVSFLSDLFVKFSVISGLIFVQRPDVVAAFLFLFTADYLLQGRLFVLPWRYAVLLGTASMGYGTYVLLFVDESLVAPFVVFLLASVSSLIYLLQLRKAQGKTEGTR